MEDEIHRLVRTNILALTPYRCARDDFSEGILLDANENSYGPSISDNTERLERYPDPYQLELKHALAAMRGCTEANIFVGVGSDEAIDMLIRIFCRPGSDEIMITSPTYVRYAM